MPALKNHFERRVSRQNSIRIPREVQAIEPNNGRLILVYTVMGIVFGYIFYRYLVTNIL